MRFRGGGVLASVVGIEGCESGDAATALLDVTVINAQDAVGDVLDARVVGDDQDGTTLRLGHFPHQLDALVAVLLVEGGRGFVGQHQARTMRERAGDSNALLLAAGKGRRIIVHVVGQANRRERLGGPVAAFLLGERRRAGGSATSGRSRAR